MHSSEAGKERKGGRSRNVGSLPEGEETLVASWML